MEVLLYVIEKQAQPLKEGLENQVHGLLGNGMVCNF